MFIRDNLDWIWRTYKYVRQGDLVIRSGFGLCGIYPYTANGTENYRHPESDTEHASGCAEIARGLMRAFPEIFSIEEWIRVFDLLKYHDLGEIAYGDRPDDGTQNTAEKNEIESATFVCAICYLPSAQKDTLYHDFVAFQNLDTDKEIVYPDANIAVFCKLCDKLDAALHAIIYELNGVGGDLAHKAEFYSPLSDRDKRYIKQTGTTKIAPNWTIHFIDICHNYPYFAMFFRILEAAVRNVNGGKFYDWLPEVQEAYGITRNHLYFCHI